MHSSGNSGMKGLIAPNIQSWYEGNCCFPYRQTHDPRSISEQINMTLFKNLSALPTSDIGLKYSLATRCCLVCAVLGFCLSLNFFPTKTRNTGLFKGRSLFASCLLLRQMFQGMREDINTCMGEERKKKKGVQVFKQCQMWKYSNSLLSPLIWQFQESKRVTTCTQNTFCSGEFRQGLH